MSKEEWYFGIGTYFGLLGLVLGCIYTLACACLGKNDEERARGLVAPVVFGLLGLLLWPLFASVLVYGLCIALPMQIVEERRRAAELERKRQELKRRNEAEAEAKAADEAREREQVSATQDAALERMREHERRLEERSQEAKRRAEERRQKIAALEAERDRKMAEVKGAGVVAQARREEIEELYQREIDEL